MNAIDFFKEEDPANSDEYSKDTTNWFYDRNDMVMFAERYHQAKLKLLGIANVEDRSEQFCTCQLPSMDMRGVCFKCGLEVDTYTNPKLQPLNNNEMIQAIISVTRQTGMDEWNTYYYSKAFDKTATLQEIEDWAKTYGKGITIFDVKLSTKD